MAGANIKIGANSSEFQKQMKEVNNQLKMVSSECGLANEKAKLFGTTTEKLGAQQKELTAKMQAQTQIVKLYQDRIANLNSDTEKQKQKQAELSTKIETTTAKYKASVEQTGKNSAESKKLKDELDKLGKGPAGHGRRRAAAASPPACAVNHLGQNLAGRMRLPDGAPPAPPSPCASPRLDHEGRLAVANLRTISARPTISPCAAIPPARPLSRASPFTVSVTWNSKAATRAWRSRS